MSFAYLVAHIDTNARPPRVVRTRIYIKSARELVGPPRGEFAFDVQVASGMTFDKACRNLLNMLNTDVGRITYGWAVEMLPEEQKL